MGDYDGGDIWVEDPEGDEPPPDDAITKHWQRELRGKYWDTRGTFFTFDPRRWHCVAPVVEGARYSVVYYTPKSLNHLDEPTWERLKKYGFPLPKNKQRFEVTLAAAEETEDEAHNES